MSVVVAGVEVVVVMVVKQKQLAEVVIILHFLV